MSQLTSTKQSVLIFDNDKVVKYYSVQNRLNIDIIPLIFNYYTSLGLGVDHAQTNYQRYVMIKSVFPIVNTDIELDDHVINNVHNNVSLATKQWRDNFVKRIELFDRRITDVQIRCIDVRQGNVFKFRDHFLIVDVDSFGFVCYDCNHKIVDPNEIAIKQLKLRRCKNDRYGVCLNEYDHLWQY